LVGGTKIVAVEARTHVAGLEQLQHLNEDLLRSGRHPARRRPYHLSSRSAATHASELAIRDRAPQRGDERLGRLNNLRTGAARTVQQQSVGHAVRHLSPRWSSGRLGCMKNKTIMFCAPSNPIPAVITVHRNRGKTKKSCCA
jgi:hypothetical protein